MNTVRNILLALCLFLGTVAWAADNSAPRLAGEGVAGRVPAWFVALPESVSNVLIADTGASTLYRYERQGAIFTRVDSRYMSVGSLGVGKQMAWDRKTPLGVYFITHELDTSRLPAKYGVAAYPLDYPNAWDLYRKRTGDGIWLHGVDPAGGQRPALDTDGCLALPNDEILSLAAVLRPLITPVIVTRNMRWVEPAELAMTRSDLLRAIEAWRVSAERSDLVGHLGLYADSFRYRDMDKALWSEYKQGVFCWSSTSIRGY